jgi:hypothetical protein
MANATGVAKKPPLQVTFDRRLKLEFHRAEITSDGGLLAYRELDDALGLTATAASTLTEGRRGKNIRHRLLGLLRTAVYGRLSGYEDDKDAERLARTQPCTLSSVGRVTTVRRPRPGRWAGSRLGGWSLRPTPRRSPPWIDRVHARHVPVAQSKAAGIQRSVSRT